jgi:uridylate kinase
MSAIAMPTHCETYERNAALRHLAEGRVVVLGGGGAAPFFTTDTTAALRAAELGCTAIYKATNVDGVYSDDPKRNPAAVRYETISHAEALARGLKVMDSTAFALAQDTRMPIIVFAIQGPRAIAEAVAGRGRFTRVEP